MENFEEKIEKWLKDLGISNKECRKIMKSPNLPDFEKEKQIKVYPGQRQKITFYSW